MLDEAAGGVLLGQVVHQQVPRNFFWETILFYQATRDREVPVFFFGHLKASSPSSRRYIFGAIESCIIILKVCYWWSPRCRNHS